MDTRRHEMADLRDAELTTASVRRPEERVDIYHALLTLDMYGLATPRQQHLIEMMSWDGTWYEKYINGRKG